MSVVDGRSCVFCVDVLIYIYIYYSMGIGDVGTLFNRVKIDGQLLYTLSHAYDVRQKIFIRV